jgi:hypothetical protein
MREKLEVMRQKKQEYLQYQRQVLINRARTGPRFAAIFYIILVTN